MSRCVAYRVVVDSVVFFFNDTATTEIYTLSLHDALPICAGGVRGRPERGRRVRHRSAPGEPGGARVGAPRPAAREDRKSTRLNSSHANISYAVFCLKKKKNCWQIRKTEDRTSLQSRSCIM